MDLFSWVPPVIHGPRAGETFDAKRDRKRLDGQAGDVFALMRDGEWRALHQISHITGHPEASISARLRDLRKPQLGGFTVERRRNEAGLFLYRVLGA
jgi:hypothetical protein